VNDTDARFCLAIPNYLEHLTMMAAKIAAPLLAQAPTPKTDEDYDKVLNGVAAISVELARRIMVKAAE